MVPMSPFLEGVEMSHMDTGAWWPFSWQPPGRAYQLCDTLALAVLHYLISPVFVYLRLALSGVLSVS